MKTHVNLLSPQFLARAKFAFILRTWAMLATLAMCCTIGWSIWERQSSRHIFIQRSDLAREYTQQRKVMADLHELQQRMRTLESQEIMILRLAAEPSLVTLLGIVSQAGAKIEGAVQIEQLNYKNGRGTDNRNVLTAGVRRLSLTGVAKDNLSIARFADAMREASVFESVELHSAGALSPNRSAQSGQTFSIQCALREPRAEAIR